MICLVLDNLYTLFIVIFWLLVLLLSICAGAYFGVTVGAGLIGILHNPVAGTLHPWMVGWCMLIMLVCLPSKIVSSSGVNIVTQ